MINELLAIASLGEEHYKQSSPEVSHYLKHLFGRILYAQHTVRLSEMLYVQELRCGPAWAAPHWAKSNLNLLIERIEA